MIIHIVDVKNNGDAIQKATGAYFGKHTPTSNVIEVPAMITDSHLLLKLMEEVLMQSSISLSDLISVTICTTDIETVMRNFDVYKSRMTKRNVKPPQALIGVQRFVLPELKIENVGTAQQ